MSGFNTRTCPLTVAFVLATRQCFGEDVRVTYVHEGDFERGEPSAGEYVIPVIE